MNQQKIDHLLSQTLEDFRLSRGERKAIKGQVDGWHQAGQLALVRSRIFELARRELIDPDSKKILEWTESMMKALQVDNRQPRLADTDVLFSPDDDCSARIQSALRTARQSVDVCVFTITDDRISNEIADAHRRKVKVRVITDDDKASDLGSDVTRLSALGCGCPHRQFALSHAPQVCRDRSPTAADGKLQLDVGRCTPQRGESDIYRR